jgi:hypothetical protein
MLPLAHCMCLVTFASILGYMVSKEDLLWVGWAGCSMGQCQLNRHRPTSINNQVAVSGKHVDALDPIFSTILMQQANVYLQK